MKKDIHPSNYRLVVFKDISNDYTFLTRSCADTKDTIKWEDGNEGQLGAIKDAGFKLTLLVKVEMEGLGPRFSGIEVYKVNGQPYVIVSEVEIESASLFKASDLPKVLKALGVN